MDENNVVLSDSQMIEIENPSSYDIEIFEAFPALTDTDTSNHALLNNREISEQHPIEAITGLREELDEIKALKQVHSDKMGVANYYEWHEGTSGDYGYFVSLVPHTSTIAICNSTEIFGVTIDRNGIAGFIGGQSEKEPRGDNYALVVTSGVADVRCTSEVVEGDYVVSDEYGMATKANVGYGYKVISAEDKNGVYYAMISLGVQGDQTHSLGKEVDFLDTRLDSAEININIAMNLANEAYAKASDCVTSNDNTSNKVNDALDRIDDAMSDMDGKTDYAIQVSKEAVVTAENIRQEAIVEANKALAEVEDLKEQGKVLYEWENPDDPTKTGVAYYVEYMDEQGVKTRMDIDGLQTQETVNNAAIKKNGKSIETLVSSVDKYTIGEYSQAYGLTLEQATSILKPGMVYIPKINGDDTTHIETYSYIDKSGKSQTISHKFTCGFSYTWGNVETRKGWIESNTKCVALPYVEDLGNNIPDGTSGALEFWFIDSEKAPEGYEPQTLYMWTETQDENGDPIVLGWVKVNTLAGNINNRITSMIRQTADSINAEVVNARGSAASLGLRISDTESEVQSLAIWSKGGDENGTPYNLATIKQTADASGASVAQIAGAVSGNYIILDGAWDEATAVTGEIYYSKSDKKYYYYKNGSWLSTTSPEDAGLVIDAASIVAAINDSGSTVRIKASHVEVDGDDFVVDVDNIDLKGYTTIEGEFSANGGFKIDENGYMHATHGGKIGGFTIGSESIYNGKTTYSDTTTDGVYLGTKGIGLGKGKFYVTDTGYLHASDATITGTVTATDGEIGGWTIGDDSISSGNVKLYSGPNDTVESLVHALTYRPCRISFGGEQEKKYTHGPFSVNSSGGFVVFISLEDRFVTNISVVATTNTDYTEVRDLQYNVINEKVEVSGMVYKISNNTPVDTDMVTLTITYAVPTLCILDDGSLYANYARISGSIMVGTGRIGGWTIGDGAISALDKMDDDIYEVIINSNLYTADNDIPYNPVFGVHNATSDTWPFMVRSNGTLVTTGMRDERLCSVVLKEGEISARGVSTSLLISGSQYIATGTNWKYTSNSGEATEHYKMLSLPWGIYFSYISNNSETSLGKIYADGNGKPPSAYNRMNIGGTWYVEGNLTGSSSGAVSSDINLKNSIKPIEEQKEYDMFFDNCIAKTFKYNNGTSDRTHIGFIAQEVKSAADVAGIDLKDLAIVCIEKGKDGAEEWALRYEEFIALNTNQIQKLKTRVAELEQQINLLLNQN